LFKACLDYADSVKGASSRNVQVAKVIEENLSFFFKKASRFDDIEESGDESGAPNN
jgi:hypothetical protein